MYLGQEMWQNMKVKQRCALLSLLDELKKRLRNKVIFWSLRRCGSATAHLLLSKTFTSPSSFSSTYGTKMGVTKV